MAALEWDDEPTHIDAGAFNSGVRSWADTELVFRWRWAEKGEHSWDIGWDELLRTLNRPDLRGVVEIAAHASEGPWLPLDAGAKTEIWLQASVRVERAKLVFSELITVLERQGGPPTTALIWAANAGKSQALSLTFCQRNAVRSSPPPQSTMTSKETSLSYMDQELPMPATPGSGQEASQVPVQPQFPVEPQFAREVTRTRSPAEANYEPPPTERAPERATRKVRPKAAASSHRRRSRGQKNSARSAHKAGAKHGRNKQSKKPESLPSARNPQTELSEAQIDLRAWVWPRPASSGHLSVLFGTLLLYGLFITGRSLSLWPLLLLPLLPGLTYLVFYVRWRATPVVEGEAWSSKVRAELDRGTPLRFLALIQVLLGGLHAAMLPAWRGSSALLELGLAVAVTGSGLATLLVVALASPMRSPVSRSFAFRGLTIFLGRAMFIGALTNGACAALMGWMLIRRMVDTPDAQTILLATALGGVLGWIRPLGALRSWGLRREILPGPLDPAAWWVSDDAVEGTAHAIHTQDAAVRLAIHGPLLPPPHSPSTNQEALNSFYGHMLKRALELSVQARETLIVLASPQPRKAPDNTSIALLQNHLHSPSSHSLEDEWSVRHSVMMRHLAHLGGLVGQINHGEQQQKLLEVSTALEDFQPEHSASSPPEWPRINLGALRLRIEEMARAPRGGQSLSIKRDKLQSELVDVVHALRKPVWALSPRRSVGHLALLGVTAFAAVTTATILVLVRLQMW